MVRKAGWAAVAVGVIGVVLLAAWQLRRSPEVPVATVQRQPLVQTVVLSARMASPTRVFLGSTVTARVAGVPRREGDGLKAGEAVVTLEDAEWRATLRQAEAALASAEARLASQRVLAAPVATQQLLQARATAEAAQRERERQEALFQQGFVGQARLDEARRSADVAQAALRAAEVQDQAQRTGPELLQAQTRVAEARAAVDGAQARLAQARILAPADAVLLQRLVEPGQIVQPGTRLAELALREPPQLVAQLDEKYLGQVSPGQAATVVADAYPGQRFAARVASLAPLVDAQRGSVELKLALPQPPAFLRDDLTVSVEIVTGEKPQALVVPAEALRAGPAVLVLADGLTALRPVKLGLRSLAQVEVTEGLQPGDQVVLDARVAAGQRARAGAARAGGAGDAAATLTQSMGR